MLTQRTDRLSSRCSSVQTWLRRAAAMALVAASSALWTAPALVAQNPEAAAKAAPREEAEAPATRRYRVTCGYADDAHLGRVIIELSELGFEIEGIELSTGQNEKTPSLVTVQLAIAASTNAAIEKLQGSGSLRISRFVPMRPAKKASAGPRVSFSFDDTDIRELIDTVAKCAKANIVVAPEVQGTITLRLHDVPWRDALDSAVETLGYAVTERSSGILVITPPHAAPAK